MKEDTEAIARKSEHHLLLPNNMHARNVCIMAMRDGENPAFLERVRDTAKRDKDSYEKLN